MLPPVRLTDSGTPASAVASSARAMVASARQRGVILGEKPAVPRISDLGRIYSSSLGKLELDMMGSHQMSERQVLRSIMAEAIREVFEHVDIVEDADHRGPGTPRLEQQLEHPRPVL